MLRVRRPLAGALSVLLVGLAAVLPAAGQDAGSPVSGPIPLRVDAGDIPVGPISEPNGAGSGEASIYSQSPPLPPNGAADTSPDAAGAEAGVTPDQNALLGESLTLEKIETLRKEAEGSAQLDEEKKKVVAEHYRVAVEELKKAQERAAKAVAFTADADQIQSRVEATKQKMADLKGASAGVDEQLSLAELEQLYAKQELELTAKRTVVFQAEAEPRRRAERRKEIRTRLAELPNRFVELKQQTEAISADEEPLVAQALKSALTAKRTALAQDYVALEAELAKYDAEDAADMIRFQRDLAAQELALAQQQQKVLAELIKVRRAQAAQDAVRQAREEMIAVDPVLKVHAERNRLLAETSQRITKKYDEADNQLKEASEKYDTLRRQYRDIKEKVNILGLTSSIGALLRKQRNALIEQSPWRTGLKDRRGLIDEAQFHLFEYDDQRAELANPDQVVEEMLTESPLANPQERQLLDSAAHDLLERRREYLDSLIKNYNQYIDTLAHLELKEKQTAALIREYQQYIDERVLWIRSGNVLVTDLQIDDSDTEFLSGERWRQIPAALWADVQEHSLVYGVILALFLTLVIKRNRLKQELRELGETALKPALFKFGPTVQATLYTVVLASISPLFLLFLAWRLTLAPGESTFAIAVGQGLFWTAVLWFPLEMLRNLCRTQGLGEAHFRWPASSLRLLGRSLVWLIPAILPLTFVTSTFYASDPTHGHDTIERVCFIAQSIIVATFLGRILHPSGVFKEYLVYNQGGWIDRLTFLWYWGTVATPLVLAGLAFWGYYYTAQVLSWRLFATLCCAMALLVLQATLVRWIMLARRKLSIAHARERAAAAAQAGDSTTTSLSNAILAEQAKEDISAHSAQSKRLLATGMFTAGLIGFWLIWSQVLPALSYLDSYGYEIESTEAVASAPVSPATLLTSVAGGKEAETADGASQNAASSTKITVSTMAFAILILAVTLISARDVPGLMEMSVLQRLPLEPSVRYAITSLTSYAIVMVGMVWAFSSLGLRWHQIQWLATALTFGLAFGLQEMFANFVAGIIILFERPIRVGDIVTVHDVTGVVSRIRIRATSITNWDRKEYVVPNKEFITGRLLNWTLTDTVNRVVIEVGVAYGTNTEEARKLLLEIADNHPLLLKDPAPVATFEGYGEGKLNLLMRCYLPNMENRLQVITDLYTAIDKTFRDARIEIAFPQRDLHIRTATGLSAALGRPPQELPGPVLESADATDSESLLPEEASSDEQSEKKMATAGRSEKSLPASADFSR